MNEIALTLEHSVEAAVSLTFAWRFRTGITNWNDPPATFALHGPFAEGSCGTTMIPGQEPLSWHLRDIRSEHSFVVELQLDDAVLSSEWRLDALSEHRTKLTQRLVLSGPNAASYRQQIEAGFGPTLAPGMNRIATEMVEASKSASSAG